MLLASSKKAFDGSISLSYSVATLKLLRVSNLTKNVSLEVRFDSIFWAFSRQDNCVDLGANKVVPFRPDGCAPPDKRLTEDTRAQTSLDDRASACDCFDYVCMIPTTNIDAMVATLRGWP